MSSTLSHVAEITVASFANPFPHTELLHLLSEKSEHSQNKGVLEANEKWETETYPLESQNKHVTTLSLSQRPEMQWWIPSKASSPPRRNHLAEDPDI